MTSCKIYCCSTDRRAVADRPRHTKEDRLKWVRFWQPMSISGVVCLSSTSKLTRGLTMEGFRLYIVVSAKNEPRTAAMICIDFQRELYLGKRHPYFLFTHVRKHAQVQEQEMLIVPSAGDHAKSCTRSTMDKD